MDDLLLSEVQIIEKNREQTKKYSGITLRSILPKNERNHQNIGLKKKKYWSQRFEEDWIKSRKRRYVGISIGHFCSRKNKALTFIQTDI